jgi:hypothetical protein
MLNNEKYKMVLWMVPRKTQLLGDLIKNYKLALYLGYKLKWDYDYSYNNSINGYFHVIEPMFKKSYNRFDFTCLMIHNYTWDFIMVEVLPKIKEDGLYDDTMSKSLNDLDLVSLFNAIMVVINKKYI